MMPSSEPAAPTAEEAEEAAAAAALAAVSSVPHLAGAGPSIGGGPSTATGGDLAMEDGDEDGTDDRGDAQARNSGSLSTHERSDWRGGGGGSEGTRGTQAHVQPLHHHAYTPGGLAAQQQQRGRRNARQQEQNKQVRGRGGRARVYVVCPLWPRPGGARVLPARAGRACKSASSGALPMRCCTIRHAHAPANLAAPASAALHMTRPAGAAALPRQAQGAV